MTNDQQKEIQRRGKRIQIYLTTQDYAALLYHFKRSGQRSLSGYLRLRLKKSMSRQFMATPEFITSITQVGREMNRIGNNLNQLARYVHTGRKAGVFNPRMIEQYNLLQQEYNHLQQQLRSELATLLSRR